MREHSITGKVTNQKLPEYVERQLAHALMEFDGMDVLIRISKKRKNRSVEQNNYYWGVVCEYFQHGAKETWGEDVSKEEAHSNLTKECNYKELVSEDSGEIFRMIKKTSDLNTLGFEEYLDRCRKFIHTWFGMQVPLPNEQTEIQYQ